MEKAKKEKTVKSKNVSEEKPKKGAKEEKTKKSSRDDKSSKKEEQSTSVRVASGYILFGKDERPKVIKEKPDLKAKEIMTELGKRWNDSDKSVKDKYNAMSAKNKEHAEAEQKKAAKKETSKPKKAVEAKKGKKGKNAGDDDDE